MRKVGILKQADSRKIHPIYPTPSGIVTPSDVEIRKLSKIAAEEGNKKIRNKSSENRSIPELLQLEKRDPELINTHITVRNLYFLSGVGFLFY